MDGSEYPVGMRVRRPVRGALRWWLLLVVGLGVAAAAFLLGQAGQPLQVVLFAAALALVGVGGSTLGRVAWTLLRVQHLRRGAAARAAQVDPNRSYASLLHPANEVVTFIGRGRELADLRRWCTSADENPVVLITGGGGVGKTRLARQLSHQLERAGWRVWAVPAGGEPAAISYVDTLEAGERLLLTLDYAEARDSRGLADLVAAVGAQRQRRRPPRLLLLARGSGEWWTYLHAYAGGGRQTLVRNVLVDATVVDLSPQVDAQTPAAIIAAAAQDLAHHLNRPVPTTQPAGFPADTPVLTLHTAALLAVLGDRPGERDDVIARLLDHEAGYWRSRAARTSGTATLLPLGDPNHEAHNRQLLRHAVGIAALFGAANPAQVQDLLRRVPGLSLDTTADAWVGWLTDLYPHPAGHPQALGSVQPDLIAETLAVTVLHYLPPDQLDTLAIRISADQATQALTVLARAATRRPDADTLIDPLINAEPFAMAQAAIRIARQFPGRYDQRLLTLATSAQFTVQQLAQLYESVPYPSLQLAPVAAVLTDRSATHPSADPADRARRASFHALRLAEVGRRPEALLVSEEAVTLRRELVAANRDAYLPNLAMSVNNHAALLAEVGRRPEALLVSEEAVTLRRELVAANRDAYLPNLAASVNNHALRLAEVGRRPEALLVSEEAVTLRRELVAANRDAYLPNLAASVNNHALRLAEVGRRPEALLVSEEAVTLYRELVAANRDAYLPDLAMSVNNHALRLAEVGRRPEALLVSEEAVTLYRELVAANRDAYLPDLAMSVNNHALRLAEVGRRPEALLVSEEAVTLRRELVAANRDAYLPNLAASVNNHALRLAEVGRRPEALLVSEEAVTLYRELVAANRDAYLPDLAMSVNNHALRLAEVGRRPEALLVSEEAVTLYRELVAANRDAYLPDLAMSVNNHALRLAEVGRRPEALLVSEEAVTLRRELVAANRDAYLPNLAMSVNNHAALLAEVGRRPEALLVSEEAVTLRRELVAANRDAYLPNLAASVNNHAALLAEVGRRPEALLVSEEAVTLRRELVAANRDAYLPNLAASVNNHALRLAEVGRRPEALLVSEEAVTLYRELVAANRDAYLPDLAASVNNHANRLAEVGRRPEALLVSEEAVTLYRELVAANRDAYLPDLAASLWTSALVRRTPGTDLPSAINAAREAESIFADLATREPQTFADRYQAVTELVHGLEGDITSR